MKTKLFPAAWEVIAKLGLGPAAKPARTLRVQQQQAFELMLAQVGLSPAALSGKSTTEAKAAFEDAFAVLVREEAESRGFSCISVCRPPVPAPAPVAPRSFSPSVGFVPNPPPRDILTTE